MLRLVLQDGSIERACESLRGGGLVGGPKVTGGVPWKGIVGPWSPPLVCFLADEGVVLFAMCSYHQVLPHQRPKALGTAGLESPKL